jgi:large subunit ribosomal protein L19
MMNIASLAKAKRNPKIPPLAPGDTVRVSSKIVEGGKERIQVFQGIVIRIRQGGNSASFTVRHVAYGIGVERTFPFFSPRVDKVEVVRHGKVRRAKLYYLRERSGKAARLKERRVSREKLFANEQVEEEVPEMVEEEILEQAQETPAETEEATDQIQEEIRGQAEEAKDETQEETEDKVKQEIQEQTQEEVKDEIQEETEAQASEETPEEKQE